MTFWHSSREENERICLVRHSEKTVISLDMKVDHTTIGDNKYLLLTTSRRPQFHLMKSHPNDIKTVGMWLDKGDVKDLIKKLYKLWGKM